MRFWLVLSVALALGGCDDPSDNTASEDASSSPDAEDDIPSEDDNGSEPPAPSHPDVDGPVVHGDILDQAYVVEWSSGTWVRPEGIGLLLSEYLENPPVIEVQSVNQNTLTLLIGAQDDQGGGQAICAPTGEIQADFTNNPWFSTEPQDTWINGTLIRDAQISGGFMEDGGAIVAGDLQGLIDLRDFEHLLDMTGTEICELQAALGVSCKACPQGGTFCIDLRVTDLQVDGVSYGLSPIATPDPTECSSWSCSTTPGGAAYLWMFALTALLPVRRRR